MVKIPYEINLTRPYEDDLEKGIQREECAICLDNTELTYTTWVQLKVCSHEFHKSCIDLWLSGSAGKSCPLCLRDIHQEEINDRSIVLNNQVVVLPERMMTIRREIEEKCLCAISCLCCLAVFVVPPIMMFVGKN
jgi:hypothetical protein